MPDFCQHFPMSRLFETQNSRGFIAPTLRNGSCSLRSRPHVPCVGFLRDVAASRHSSNKFGSALDFRNVIEIQLLRGCKKISLLSN